MHPTSKYLSLALLSSIVIIYSCVIMLLSIKPKKAQYPSNTVVTNSGFNYMFHHFTADVNTKSGPVRIVDTKRTIQGQDLVDDLAKLEEMFFETPTSFFISKNGDMFHFNKSTREYKVIDVSKYTSISKFTDTHSLLSLSKPGTFDRYEFLLTDNTTGELTKYPYLKQFCNSIYCGTPRVQEKTSDEELLIGEGAGDSCFSSTTLSLFNMVTHAAKKITTTEFSCGDGDFYIGTDKKILYFVHSRSSLQPGETEHESDSIPTSIWSINLHTMQKKQEFDLSKIPNIKDYRPTYDNQKNAVILISETQPPLQLEMVSQSTIPTIVEKPSEKSDQWVKNIQKYVTITSQDTPIKQLIAVDSDQLNLSGIDTYGNKVELWNVGHWQPNRSDGLIEWKVFVKPYLRLVTPSRMRFILNIQKGPQDATSKGFLVGELNIENGHVYNMGKFDSLDQAIPTYNW